MSFKPNRSTEADTSHSLSSIVQNKVDDQSFRDDQSTKDLDLSSFEFPEVPRTHIDQRSDSLESLEDYLDERIDSAWSYMQPGQENEICLALDTGPLLSLSQKPIQLVESKKRKIAKIYKNRKFFSKMPNFPHFSLKDFKWRKSVFKHKDGLRYMEKFTPISDSIEILKQLKFEKRKQESIGSSIINNIGNLAQAMNKI